MRGIINSTYVALDGVIENPPDWPSGRHEDDGRGSEIQTTVTTDWSGDGQADLCGDRLA